MIEYYTHSLFVIYALTITASAALLGMILIISLARLAFYLLGQFMNERDIKDPHK